MRSRSAVIRGLAAALLIAALTSCTSTPKQESTGGYIDDSTITAKIRTELLADDILEGVEVSVETFKGIVLLSGSVDTEATKQRAGLIAAKIAGVKDVRNNVVVM